MLNIVFAIYKELGNKKKRKRNKEKGRQKIFARGLQISNLNKIGQLV